MKKLQLPGETVSLNTGPELASPRFDDTVRHLVVRELAGLSPPQYLDWIRQDQQQRWRKGIRIPIEAYLELPPLASADSSLILDLIYSEFILRQEHNETPRIEEFVRRFRTLEEPLRRLLSVDLALLSEMPAASTHEGRHGKPRPAAKSVTLPAIGKYPILSVLAEGGQGVVYRALHPTLSKEVIIKWSKATIEASERDHLLAEGRLLARIDHPNLVRVFDLDFHDGRPFLVMEAIDAVDLAQYRERALPDARKSALLVAAIARALDTVHRKGIIHRDIKPRNILIDQSEQPRLIDFGLAAWRHGFAEPPADSHFVSGTLAYMPPEQARGAASSIGPRSDIFGLGGVLYYLLTGHAPYREKDTLELYCAVREGIWDRAALEQSGIPPRLRAICTKALHADPQERYASALELAADLEAYLHRPAKIARYLAAGTAVLAGCALVGWLAFHKPVEIDPKPGPEKNEHRLQLPPSKLVVDVVRKRAGRAFALEDALPIITGQELRVTMELPANHAAALLHFSEGKWTLLQDYPAENLARSATFPSADKRVPLEGKAGTEFLLFCARPNSPIDVTELQGWLGTLPAFPAFRDDQTYFTLNEMGPKQWHRGAFGKAAKGEHPDDIAFAQLDRIHTALRGKYNVYAGVLFVHKAP